MAKVEEDVMELRERLDKLESIVQQLRWERPPAARRVQYTDKEALRPVVERVMRELGIPENYPTKTPEEIKEQMEREGVRPEDYIFSIGLAEMRGDPEERLSGDALEAYYRQRGERK